jgi:hypothetical protein
MAAIIKNKEGKLSSEKYQNEIERNKQIAAQLKQAAEFHLEVANNLENDYIPEAFEAAINAIGLVSLIRDAQQIILRKLPI